MNLKRINLDNQLTQTYKLDENGKVIKKKKKKNNKGGLKNESKQRVRGKRESSLRLMRGRSLLLLDYSKLERETLEIWIKLIKSRGESAKECPQLNHAQFNICMMDNNIKIDPDLSVTLFWTLITVYERKKKPKQSANLLTPIDDSSSNNTKNDNKNDNSFPETKSYGNNSSGVGKITAIIMKDIANKIKNSVVIDDHHLIQYHLLIMVLIKPFQF